MCTCTRYEIKPIVVPIGSTIPYIIPIYQSIGKFPIIEVEIVNVDGSTDDAPDITVRRYRDSHDYITSLELMASGGTTTDELIIIIHPQNITTI